MSKSCALLYILASLLHVNHYTTVAGVSQTLRCSARNGITEVSTYIQLGGHSSLFLVSSLLRPRQQLQSTVSACPRAYLRNHTRDLCHIVVHVTYGRGSVLIWPHLLSAGTGWRECTAWVTCNLLLPCFSFFVCIGSMWQIKLAIRQLLGTRKYFPSIVLCRIDNYYGNRQTAAEGSRDVRDEVLICNDHEMVQRHSQGVALSLRAYIAVCPETHCNPSSYVCLWLVCWSLRCLGYACSDVSWSAENFMEIVVCDYTVFLNL